MAYLFCFNLVPFVSLLAFSVDYRCHGDVQFGCHSVLAIDGEAGAEDRPAEFAIGSRKFSVVSDVHTLFRCAVLRFLFSRFASYMLTFSNGFACLSPAFRLNFKMLL